MDLANKEGGIVIGTGDMSELALEWADENRFENESSDGRTVREILEDILGTPISP
jgi:NAD+ synthase (glutamine-hydrolysing)